MSQDTLVQTRAAVSDEDMTIEEVLEVIRKSLEDKKAEKLIILDVSEHCDYLDYLVIASGYTENHNRALIDNVAGDLASYDIIGPAIQGYRKGDWIVADYGVVVVHVFLQELREFYRLEALWESGEIVYAGSSEPGSSE